MQAKGHHVILQQTEAKTSTESGIMLSPTEKPQNIGKVISVGELVNNVKPEDEIVFGQLVSKFRYDGKDWLVVMDGNVIAVL